MADRHNYPASYAGYEKDKKTSWFTVIYSYSKDGAFTTVKRDAAFLARNVKEVPFINERYTNGYRSEMSHYRAKMCWAGQHQRPTKIILSPVFTP